MLEVTSEQFAQFVEATGYKTVAEREPNPADFPGAPPENLVPGSMLFHKTRGPVDLSNYINWWTWVPGTSWRYPLGRDPRSKASRDTRSFTLPMKTPKLTRTGQGKNCRPKPNGSLPLAAGLTARRLPGAMSIFPAARLWRTVGRGSFPGKTFSRTATTELRRLDLFRRMDTVCTTWLETFGSGLADWFVRRHADEVVAPCCGPAVNPRIVSPAKSYDPAQPQFRIPRKVVKGGSHLCAPNYCLRYRPAARQPQMIDTSMNHIGFRCIVHNKGTNG